MFGRVPVRNRRGFAVECVLRPISDSAYVRNDPPWLRKRTAAPKQTTLVRPLAASSAVASPPTARRDTSALKASGKAGRR